MHVDRVSDKEENGWDTGGLFMCLPDQLLDTVLSGSPHRWSEERGIVLLGIYAASGLQGTWLPIAPKC